jgi:hypothetical protein
MPLLELLNYNVITRMPSPKLPNYNMIAGMPSPEILNCNATTYTPSSDITRNRNFCEGQFDQNVHIDERVCPF